MAAAAIAAAGCERSEMTIDELNAKFGAPGRIVFRQGFAGYPEAVIANKYGAAEVALLGANVLSYRPTGLGETLFRPAKRDYNRGDKFHGGIPLCWPQFGNRFSKDLPQHGFASKMPFEVRGTEYTEEKTSVTLGLRASAATRDLWPVDFDLEVTVTVSMKLNVLAKTTNTGNVLLAFNCGFHPYFLLRDRNETVVRGFDGVKYIDARACSTATSRLRSRRTTCFRWPTPRATSSPSSTGRSAGQWRSLRAGTPRRWCGIRATTPSATLGPTTGAGSSAWSRSATGLAAGRSRRASRTNLKWRYRRA